MVNAVYHRSYEIREPVEVRITREELVILSFPSPDRSIKKDAMSQGKAVSRRYRNRRISEYLKELELTEGRSTGIPKMLRVMAANGSPEPEFETDEDRTHYLVRLPVHANTDWQDLAAPVEARVKAQEGGSTPQVEISSRQEEATPGPSRDQVEEPSRDQVKILRKCLPESNIKQLMGTLKRTNRTKFRHQVLSPLIEQGFIEMTQPNSPSSPTQKYRLTAKGQELLKSL